MKKYILLLSVIWTLLSVFGCSQNFDRKNPVDPQSPNYIHGVLLSLPANGTTNVISTSPTLCWNATSGASSYRLQVSTSSLFTNMVYDQSGLTNTNQTINGISSSTTYYWRVNAANLYGTSIWSSVWIFTTSDATLIEWISIPSGNFTMGSLPTDPYAYANEQPQHTVYLDAYQISKYEITNSQYKVFMDAGGYSTQSYWSDIGWAWRTTNSITEPRYWSAGTYNNGTAFPNHPVNGVSWYEAYAFCNWAGGHLPTEAQWEKAARGTVASNYWPWGSSWDEAKCNSYYGTVPDTFYYSSPVGFFTAGQSPYGVYDMAGNVLEWCNDWYGSAYYSDPGATTNPIGPTSGTDCVLRGGGCGSSPNGCRVAIRGGGNPEGWSLDIGFRVVK